MNPQFYYSNFARKNTEDLPVGKISHIIRSLSERTTEKIVQSRWPSWYELTVFFAGVVAFCWMILHIV